MAAMSLVAGRFLRIQGLLERASGKEAIVDIGKRFKVVTPWSAIVVEDRAVKPIDHWLATCKPGGLFHQPCAAQHRRTRRLCWNRVSRRQTSAPSA